MLDFALAEEFTVYSQKWEGLMKEQSSTLDRILDIISSFFFEIPPEMLKRRKKYLKRQEGV